MDVASVADHGGAGRGDAILLLVLWATLCVAIRKWVQLVKDVLVEDGNCNPCTNGLEKGWYHVYYCLRYIYYLPAPKHLQLCFCTQQGTLLASVLVPHQCTLAGELDCAVLALTLLLVCMVVLSVVLSQGVNVGYGLAPHQPHTHNFIVCCYNFNGHVLLIL